MPRNLSVGLGIGFQPGFQDGLLGSRGSDMLHEVGVACAKCRTSDTAANMLGDGKLQTRLPNCPRCGGDGMLYRNATLLRGLATSIRQQKNILDLGHAQPGDLQFSLTPASVNSATGTRRIAQGDKFTATWPQPLDDGQTIVRGAATMGENLRLANNVGTEEDRLYYEPHEVLWCEDEDGVTYNAGDFTLGPGRVIRWAGKQPRVGRKYTLKYTAYLEWLVWAPPQERVDVDSVDLGPLVFLRRRHVAFVNDSPFITDNDRIPLSIRRTAC